MKPIVRFAPSPTGELHLGGARVALFNYLYAKKHQGHFLIRIEDTDLERSKQIHVDQICDSLKWLGLGWDRDIFIQSQNKVRHKEIINRLLLEGKAYKCFSSREELEIIKKKTKSYSYTGIWRDRPKTDIKIEEEKGSPYSIRLKTPIKGQTNFFDKVYGNISVNNSEIDDFILARSDENNTPVYNLVVTVDDYDMKITHVIRGEDHISNTVKQILIIKALGWEIPDYAHLPMILGPNGDRLSKRHGATGVQTYQNLGYQSQGLLNYLAFLGWNPGTEEEVMGIDRLIKLFDLEKVQKKGAIFDQKKLDWISGQHLSKQSSLDIKDDIKKINSDWGDSYSNKFGLSVITLMKDRVNSLVQLIEDSSYFFEEHISYQTDLINKIWKSDTTLIVDNYKNMILKIELWDAVNIELLTKNYMEENNIGFGKLMKPIRYILCGILNGPPLYEIINLLGREVFKKRIEKALREINVKS